MNRRVATLLERFSAFCRSIRFASCRPAEGLGGSGYEIRGRRAPGRQAEVCSYGRNHTVTDAPPALPGKNRPENTPAGKPTRDRILQEKYPGRWLVFSFASLLFILSQFYRVSNAIIAPDLQQELQLSGQQLGLLSAAFFYAFAAAQIPLGVLIDRIGARWTMTLLTLVGAGGAMLFAAAHSLSVAVAGRALLGIGMAGNLMGSLKLLTHWFSAREFATLSGLMLALGTVGNMLAATPLAYTNVLFGWRWTFTFLGGATLAAALFFFLLVREHPVGREPPSTFFSQPGWFGPLLSLFQDRNYWIISMGTFFRYGTFVAIQGLWAGPYLIEGLGLSPVQSGNLVLLLNVGLVLGSPFGGWLSDRVLQSRKKVIGLGLAVMGLAQLGLALGWGEHHWWLLGLLFFVFGVFGSFGIVMYAHIKELMPEEMTGTAMTGINLFTMLGGAAFLQGLGWVVDHWSLSETIPNAEYKSAFLTCAVGAGGAFVAYLFTRDTHPR